MSTTDLHDRMRAALAPSAPYPRALRTAVLDVVNLHHPDEWDHCAGEWNKEPVGWPCDTIQILAAALLPSTATRSGPQRRAVGCTQDDPMTPKTPTQEKKMKPQPTTMMRKLNPDGSLEFSWPEIARDMDAGTSVPYVHTVKLERSRDGQYINPSVFRREGNLADDPD